MTMGRGDDNGIVCFFVNQLMIGLIETPPFVIPHSGWRESARRVMRDPGDWGRCCDFVKKEKAFNWVPHLRGAHASLRAG